MPTEPKSPLSTSMSISALSIPTAYALGLAPHVYYLTRMMIASNFAWTNVTPRSNWETLKGKVPTEVFNRCLRARGAHLNSLETWPLFAVAMLAGSGRVPQDELDRTAIQFLGVRALYTLAYVGIRSEVVSYVRTGLWVWSVALPVGVLVRVARMGGGGAGVVEGV